MKLPDFLEFEPFNQLRNTMGAEQLGDFVFFDPKKTSQVWSVSSSKLAA